MIEGSIGIVHGLRVMASYLSTVLENYSFIPVMILVLHIKFPP